MQIDQRSEGSERRRYKRYNLGCDGICLLSSGRRCDCRILDLCKGGMFVEILDQEVGKAVIVGSRISISCVIPDVLSGQTFVFDAAVVRGEGNRFGVRLEKAAPESIEALIAFARTSRKVDSQSHISGTDSARVEAVLVGCRRQVFEVLPDLLSAFAKGSADAIFENIEKIKGHKLQNDYYAAMSLLGQGLDEFQGRFLDSVKSAMVVNPAVSGSGSQPSDSTDEPSGYDGLSLMDDALVEDWLTTTDIVSHVESKNKEQLYALCQRLGHLYGCVVDSETNPFRPYIFSEAFQEAIHPWDLEQGVYKICFKQFRCLLVDASQTLYERINQHLIEQGVLPDLKYQPPVARSSKGKRPESEANTAQDKAKPEVVDEEIEKDTASDRDPGQGDILSGRAGGLGRDAQGARNMPGVARQQESTTETVPNQQHSRSIYDIVDDLEKLRNELLSQGVSQMGQGEMNDNPPQIGGRPTAHQVFQGHSQGGGCIAGAQDSPQQIASGIDESAQGDAVQETYSVDEMMQALDAMQQSGQGRPSMDYGDFLSRIDGHLQNQTGERRLFPKRERRIMDVGNRIFSSMRGDPQVSGQVKSWLHELEIPLLKLALEDDSLFMDRAHILRRIINSVSMLELYGDETGGESAVCKKIDRLVNRIGKYRAGDNEGVLTQALHELEMLIDIQDDAYRENFIEVVRGCQDEQDDFTENGRDAETAFRYLKTDAQDSPAVEGGANHLSGWLDRVHRLKLETWVMIKSGVGEASRLKLAWVTKEKDRYVFVNLMGQREVTLSDLQLARLFGVGDAMVLENANDPAIDRAQHTMLQKLHHQLLFETTHDATTNLLNRKEFEKHFARLVFDCSAGDNGADTHILCCLDVIGFRSVNEKCGSGAGDLMLRQIGDLLSAAFSEGSPIARLGNDTFSMLVSGSVESAVNQLKDFNERLNHEKFSYEGKEFPIALNAGVVSVNASVGSPSNALVAAEEACKKAKLDPNQIYVGNQCGADEGDSAMAMEWLVKVNEAITSKNIVLRCQPIIGIAGEEIGSVHHSEVLIGICNERGESVSPQDFILAAERYNRMPALDRLIVRETFSWICDHQDLMVETGPFAINLSGKSLNDDSFLDFLVNEIRSSGVPVEQICFEVTETAGVDSLSKASEFIEAVQAMGCSFSLDDFGSGMSSYGYLKNLPVDYLKIDGVFVKEMDINQEDYAIVKSITEIGHFMDKKVIAECVENERILELLKEIGVDYVQGYHLCKPYPLSSLEEKGAASQQDVV